MADAAGMRAASPAGGRKACAALAGTGMLTDAGRRCAGRRAASRFQCFIYLSAAARFPYNRAFLFPDFSSSF